MLDLQKASTNKRISAFLFDLIIFFIFVIGVGCIVNPIIGFDTKVYELEAVYNKYCDEYGIDPELTQEEYDKMTKEEQDAYNAAVKLANEALNKDEEAVGLFTACIVLGLSMITISTLVSYLALEFAIPLLLGNGQTLGKKIFGVALMRADGVRIAPLQVFVRAILGKFTLETMIPILLIGMLVTNIIGSLGLVLLVAIAGLEAFVYWKSQNGSLIHDIIAVTVCVDLQSQLIFETEEDLIEYKKQMAERSVGKFGYGSESASSVYSSVTRNEVSVDDVDNSDATDSSTEFSSVTFGTISVGDVTYTNTAVSIPEIKDGEKEEGGEELPEATETEEAPSEAVAEDLADEATEEESEDTPEEGEDEDKSPADSEEDAPEAEGFEEEASDESEIDEKQGE